MQGISFGLEDKVFVVTGGSRGIGKEIVTQLLAQGARVVACARKADGLRALADETANERLLTVAAHVAQASDVDRLFEATLDAFGALDGLVNNVGMNIATGTTDADFGLWQKIVDTNLNGTFLCARKAGQVMRTGKRGKIVNVTSIAARRAAPFMGIYGVAKAGIEMLTRVLAQELAAFNIQVNAVAPCMVRTKFSEPFWSNAEVYAQVVKGIPLGRIAEAHDVSLPTLFLCSAAADFITGQVLAVDGGASAV